MPAVRYRKNPPTLSSKEPIKLQEYLRFQIIKKIKKDYICPSNSRKFQLPKRYPSNTRTTLYAPSEAGNRPYVQRTGMTFDVFRRTR